MSWCESLQKVLPVLLVLIGFGWAYYCYVIVFGFSVIRSLVKRTIYLIVFHLLLLLTLYTYFVTMSAPLDTVPETFKLSPKDYELLKRSPTDEMKHKVLREFCNRRRIVLYTTTETGGIRFCWKCKQVKPDRAHHCSMCRTCVLKMDHHCPWVNNCIGFTNYKLFILFLFYTTLLCGFMCATSTPYFISYWTGPKKGTFENYIMIILWVMSFVAFMPVGSFFGYHASLMAHNETTLEAIRDTVFVSRNFTYDLGCCENYEEVFGDNYWLWLIPIPTMFGDGIEFPLGTIDDGYNSYIA